MPITYHTSRRLNNGQKDRIVCDTKLCQKHSETLLPLALIRLTNAASQLPYGSGETKGVLVLRTHLNVR